MFLKTISKYLFLIILFQVFSCKKSETKEINVNKIISEQHKYDLFKKLIKDTINVFTMHYRNAYVSRKTFQSTVRPLNTENGINHKTKAQLILEYYFKINDTLFISNQIKKDNYLSISNPIVNKYKYLLKSIMEYTMVFQYFIKKQENNWVFDKQVENWMR